MTTPRGHRMNALRNARDEWAARLNDRGDAYWEDWLRCPPDSMFEAFARLNARLIVLFLAVIGAERVGPTP